MFDPKATASHLDSTNRVTLTGGGNCRGRDASYLAPPAQIRTGPIRAYGSRR
jgi:hypothetical protein